MGKFPSGYGMASDYTISVYKFFLDDSMLAQLADALRGNTTVTHILFPWRDFDTITDAGIAYLGDAIAESAVDYFFSGGYISKIREMEETPEFMPIEGIGQELQEAIQSHCTRNAGITKSLRHNRPLQRLLVAALPVSTDLQGMVLQHLTASRTSPFATHGKVVVVDWTERDSPEDTPVDWAHYAAEEESEVFAWHNTGPETESTMKRRRIGPPSELGGGGSSGGEK